MWNILIIIIIVSLTIGYLECIFSKIYKNHIYTSVLLLRLREPSHHWLAALVHLCARLSEAPSVLFGFPALCEDSLSLKLLLSSFALCAWFLEPIMLWLSLYALCVVRKTKSSLSLRVKAR